MKDNFFSPQEEGWDPSVSYSACYETPGMSPGLSGEEVSTDVKSCTPSQILSSLGWVATCLTSGPPLNESLSSDGLVLSKHVSDFLKLLAKSKELALEQTA